LFAGYCSQTEKTKDSHSSLALPKVYGQWVADEKLRLLFGLVEYPPLCGWCCAAHTGYGVFFYFGKRVMAERGEHPENQITRKTHRGQSGSNSYPLRHTSKAEDEPKSI